MTQRGVRLSERDGAALETLFFVDWMDIAGLRDLHYTDAQYGTCANRLYSDGSEHLLAVSDLYAGVAKHLRPHLGALGIETWYWRNERRACSSYWLGASYHVYRPDAELVVAIPESAHTSVDGELSYAHLLIEVQTVHGGAGAARVTEQKVEAFARTFPVDGRGRTSDRHAFAHRAGRDPMPNRRSLCIATESPAHTHAAMGAADRLGLRHCWAEGARSIANRITAHALDPMGYLA